MSDEPKPEGAPKPPEEPLKPPAESKPAPPVEAAKPAAPPAPPKPPAPKPPPPPAVMQTTPWEGDLPSALKEEFGDGILGSYEYLGQRFLECSSTLPVAILSYLKLEFDFDYLVDVTAVDYPNKPERFELIYVLYSFARNERVRIKTRLAEGTRATSAFGVHLTADWLEREVFDMFGIEFDGHPNMKRILLPDEWEGYPLRKDYGILQMDNQWVRDNLGIESGQ